MTKKKRQTSRLVAAAMMSFGREEFSVQDVWRRLSSVPEGTVKSFITAVYFMKLVTRRNGRSHGRTCFVYRLIDNERVSTINLVKVVQRYNKLTRRSRLAHCRLIVGRFGHEPLSYAIGFVDVRKRKRMKLDKLVQRAGKGGPVSEMDVRRWIASWWRAGIVRVSEEAPLCFAKTGKWNPEAAHKAIYPHLYKRPAPAMPTQEDALNMQPPQGGDTTEFSAHSSPEVVPVGRFKRFIRKMAVRLGW